MAVGAFLFDSGFPYRSLLFLKAAPGSQDGNADINVGFHPDNNRYLEVHEYSGFESEDAESLKTIRDFISYRTDSNRSVSERLHAIW